MELDIKQILNETDIPVKFEIIQHLLDVKKDHEKVLAQLDSEDKVLYLVNRSGSDLVLCDYNDPILKGFVDMSEKIEVRNLSNKLDSCMVDMIGVQKQNRTLREINSDKQDEIEALKSRNWWGRLLNK